MPTFFYTKTIGILDIKYGINNKGLSKYTNYMLCWWVLCIIFLYNFVYLLTFVYNNVMTILVNNHFITTYKVNFYLIYILELGFTIKKIVNV